MDFPYRSSLVYLTLASGLFASANARALTFEEISQALRQDPQATWSPRPSVLQESGLVRSGLVPEEAAGAGDQHFLPQYFAARSDNLQSQPTTEPGLPARFDWREEAAGALLPPVGAQGKCSSCVAFAAVSTLEAQLNIACGAGAPEFHLSRQYLFSCGGGSCRSGWRLSEAMDYLAQHGVPDEACMPYSGSPANGQLPCESACSNADARLVKGIVATRPTTGFIDVVEIKRALKRGPLVANMILFEDLEYFGDGVYQHVKGNQVGSHAIVFVGWDDHDRAWIARNSWGPSWGDGGYFKVKWDDVSLPGRYTWVFDVANAVSLGVCGLPR